MTLQQLHYFLAAAEHGSFSAAAAELHMAQPSLSEQVRRLEAELGVALFERAGRRLELTEAGRLLRPRAERTIAAAEEASETVRAVRDLTGGTATFGMFGNAPSWFLQQIVGDFRRRHPGVRVRLVGQNSSAVADEVREGRIEAGLVILPVDDRGLDVRPVIRDEILYLSADEANCGRPITPERLAEAELVLFDATFGRADPTRRQLHEFAQRAGHKLEPTIEVEDVEAALELAARGLGDTATAMVMVSKSLARRLHQASFDPPLYDTVAFINRHDAVLSPATRAFMEITEKRIEALGRAVSDETREHLIAGAEPR